jgi:cysteine synthase A
MIIASPLELQWNDLFYHLSGFPHGTTDVYLKIEGYNIAGSVKLKPALQMIQAMEAQGILQPGKNKIIESSSGNLGVALSIVCHVKGYPFTCVTDPNITPHHEKQIRQYGGKIIKVTDKDANGGYLQTRITLIQDTVRADPSYVWTNQYANEANIQAHYEHTAPAIHREFPTLDYLFLGAGTTGTLGGCARYFQKHAPATKIIAVDSLGSVTFGGPPGKRHIPGLGTSRRPEIFSMENVHAVIMVPEIETIAMCYEMLETYGLWIGGSTGTVLCGVRRYQDNIEDHATVVALSPDLGERYVDTVYNPDWVEARFGEHMAQAASRFNGLPQAVNV